MIRCWWTFAVWLSILRILSSFSSSIIFSLLFCFLLSSFYVCQLSIPFETGHLQSYKKLKITTHKLLYPFEKRTLFSINFNNRRTHEDSFFKTNFSLKKISLKNTSFKVCVHNVARLKYILSWKRMNDMYCVHCKLISVICTTLKSFLHCLKQISFDLSH